ncbi:hypothetical protein KPH14_012610 [Odynerus spinipes]|uniref:Uncharacterized protein n=1 Tax=Odynerus spinipes TaxID=1348599 RepID=A0AAD9R8S0_9HYME|nr:hypothetical protein KPH14_012610 [Odynerus spinipes]
MNELEATTNEFYELLLDVTTTTESEMQQEYDDADVYKRKFLTAKLTVGDCVAAKTSETPLGIVSAVQGESLFKKIHDDQNIAEEDKLQYLLQATVPGFRAEELVKSYPPTGDNYAKVIASLRNRYGREDLQIEVYVRELLQLVLQNAVTPAKEISQLRALESLGVTTDKCAAMLRPLVESSSPPGV